jgi:hypothetical protein
MVPTPAAIGMFLMVAARWFVTMEWMGFQWLQMRIGEEQDRRRREEKTLEMLPEALQDLNRQLRECIETFKQAFGADSAEIHYYAGKIRIRVNEQRNGKWEPVAKVDVSALPSLPGFKVDRGEGDPVLIGLGLLPGDKLFYRHADQFLTMEEVTRRVLDRALFPKLGE